MSKQEAVEPKRLSWDEIPDATEAEIEAHNAAVEQELDARIAEKDASKRKAIGLLRDQAKSTAKTAKVRLDTMSEPLEVRSRIPSRVEMLQEQLQDVKASEDIGKARALACQMIASMVVGPDGFDDPEVWEIASRDADAGISWLMEVSDKILGPATEKARSLKGNAEP